MRTGPLLILALLLITPVLAEQIVVNSADWRDVHTGLQYAAATGTQGYFAINPEQAVDLANRLGDDTDILLINGREQAAPGLRSLLRARGYTIQEYQSRDALDANEEFARRAPTKNLVVVDDAYGYNAISTSTYARVRNASIVFADTDVEGLIEQKAPDEILLYGHIPAERFEALSAYDPVVINEQDRFEDNFALVKRFVSSTPRESLILTNGEFIEQQLITDTYPVLFTGRQNVPDEVVELIEDNGFAMAVLVGNSLAPNAKYIKDKTGISIFIKFAQGRNEQQYALDLFPVPIPEPLVTITQAEYDATQHALLITYQNPGDVPTYLSASYQTPEGTVEDEEIVFIEAGTYKTVRYEMADPQTELPYTIIYGASPNSLELLMQGSVQVDKVSVEDLSAITLAKASYAAGEFRVRVENTGPVEAYVLLEAADVRIGGERVRLASEVTRIAQGRSTDIVLPAQLTERDAERNQEIELEAFYGQRPFSLVKSERATLPVTPAEGVSFWLVSGAAAVAVLLAWFVTRRKKRRYPTF